MYLSFSDLSKNDIKDLEFAFKLQGSALEDTVDSKMVIYDGILDLLDDLQSDILRDGTQNVLSNALTMLDIDVRDVFEGDNIDKIENYLLISGLVHKVPSGLFIVTNGLN